MSNRRVWFAMVGLAVLGSQAGHLLAYQLRFGAAAQHLQGSGPHAYYPALAKTGLGILAAAIIGAVFMVGLARIVGRRTLHRESTGPPYRRLVAAMFTIQLGVFVAQELGESAFAGIPGPSPAVLLLWGTLGQLPVAALAAAALLWLLVRYRSAIEEIGAAIKQVRIETALAPLLRPVATGSGAALPRSNGARATLGERGPPSSLRYSSS